MASAAEREIRDSLTEWWHINHPQGRVIHELPLESMSANGRADMAIVFRDIIVLIEIKSERDKLTRLEKQFDAMRRYCHDWLIVCHEKWFDNDGGLKDQAWCNYAVKEHLWRYPASDWSWDQYKQRYGHIPNNYCLLSLLWRNELAALYNPVGMAYPPRHADNMWAMQRDLHDKLTGAQVRKLVCRTLRAREFSEADPPIIEELAA